MRVSTGLPTLSTLCIGLLSGCSLFQPVSTETTKNLLDSVPHQVPSGKPLEADLLVLVPDTAPVYATTRMAYSTRTHQIAYFSRNEWAGTPTQMIQPLIVETLRDTHHFREVLSPPDFRRHALALRTEILELEQDFTFEPAMLRLAMRAQVYREATNEVVATRELSVQEPMAERTPYAGVVAANKAMAALLHQLAKFVVESTD
jgi:cholesterol transport system auxiliary component